MENDNKKIENSIKIYELFRDRIKHQDVLISHRVGYFLIMQSAIIYMFTSNINNIDKLKWLCEWPLPAMGWLLAFGLLISIYNSFNSIENCLELYSRIDKGQIMKDLEVKMIALAPSAFGVSEINALPPLRSSYITHIFGHSMAWLVVLLALFLWPVIFCNTENLVGAVGSNNGILFGSIQGIFFYIFEIISLGSFLFFFFKHFKKCKENNSMCTYKDE